jgi:hypothetical protein
VLGVLTTVAEPRVLFRPTPLPAENAQQQLTQALATVIGEDDDGGRARKVAGR